MVIPIINQGMPQNEKVTRKVHKTVHNSKLYTEYSFDEKSKEELPPPGDNERRMPELVSQQLVSVPILNTITSQIFTEQEAKYLAENKCYLSCIISSDGEIYKVRVLFPSNFDPEVNTDKLSELIRQVKKNLKYDLTFDRKVVHKGYITLNHQAFPNLMKKK
jgi:hypothetical protein